jgi:tetratricopeptide (TPR) repeat protein
MTIQSSIRELGLFDLFQVLYMNRKTGRLLISGTPQGADAQVLFHEGAVCFAAIHNRVPKSISALLIEWGVLNEASRIKVELAMQKYHNLLDCLESEGLVSRNHMENFLASRVRECVFEIFKWDKGEYSFIEEQLDRKREVLITFNTENLILEGARRIDEWSNIKNKVPSEHSVFRICSENEDNQGMNLKPKEWEILSLIDGKRSVAEVNEAVGEDLFSTSKLIYGLVVMGVIELVEGKHGEGPGSDVERRVQELIRSGREFYDNLNLEKAAAEFEKAVQIDPECFEALRMLGEIYYKLDRLSEALVYLRKARTIKPENQKAMFIKGYLHARLGEVEQAIEEWEELREKTKSPKVIQLVRKRITVAREWEKVLQEY